MIWFSSDLHLGHEAAIRFCDRPYGCAEEMNEAIITNFNERVEQNDTIYLLGDLAHRIRVDEANDLIRRLNGKKILCRGNHDKQYDPRLFDGIYDFLEIHVDGINLSLMHYPMMEWPKSRHGSIHLHGHMHNYIDYNLKQRMDGCRRYDVGVDANNYYPVSLDDIKDFFML